MLCKMCGLNEVPENKIRARDYTCNKCYYIKNKESQLANKKLRRDKDREIVFNHYGNECAYCGSTKNLTIDHIEANGKEHRKSSKISGGSNTYRYLVKNDLPTGYQTLCHYCNTAKGDKTDAEFRAWIRLVDTRLNGPTS